MMTNVLINKCYAVIGRLSIKTEKLGTHICYSTLAQKKVGLNNYETLHSSFLFASCRYVQVKILQSDSRFICRRSRFDTIKLFGGIIFHGAIF